MKLTLRMNSTASRYIIVQCEARRVQWYLHLYALDRRWRVCAIGYVQSQFSVDRHGDVRLGFPGVPERPPTSAAAQARSNPAVRGPAAKRAVRQSLAALSGLARLWRRSICWGMEWCQMVPGMLEGIGCFGTRGGAPSTIFSPLLTTHAQAHRAAHKQPRTKFAITG